MPEFPFYSDPSTAQQDGPSFTLPVLFPYLAQLPLEFFFFFFQIKFMEISLTLNNLLKEKGFRCMITSKMCSIQAACHHFV